MYLVNFFFNFTNSKIIKYINNFYLVNVDNIYFLTRGIS